MKKLIRFILMKFIPCEGDVEPRPDWCPEKFYDDNMGVRAQPMAEAFVELEGKLRSNKETLAEEIKSERMASLPEKYDLVIPENLEVPDGVELNLTDEDPLVSSVFAWAKTEGISQEGMNNLIEMYMKSELAGMPDMTKEIGKLGDYGQDRLLKVQNWMSDKLDEDQMKELAPMLTSATSIEALEKLMSTSGPGKFDGDNATPAMSLEELRTMQKDPRYHQERDTAFIAKVTAGYARLYKGQ